MRRLIGIGWAFFALSGVFYLVAGVRDRDGLVIWGSIVWLVGVGFFLFAFFSDRNRFP